MCPYLYNVHEATRMAVVEGYDYDLIGKLSLGSSPHKGVADLVGTVLSSSLRSDLGFRDI